MYDFPPRTPRNFGSILLECRKSYLSKATIIIKIKMCIFRKCVHFPQAIHKKSYKTRFERGKVCNLQNLALSLRQLLKTKRVIYFDKVDSCLTTIKKKAH